MRRRTRRENVRPYERTRSIATRAFRQDCCAGGAVTGVLSFLVGGVLTNPVLPWFCGTQAVIAIVAGIMASKGWFRTLPRTIVTGIVIGIAAGIVSAPVIIKLFGGITGSGSGFITSFLLASGKKVLDSVILTGLSCEPIDKTLQYQDWVTNDDYNRALDDVKVHNDEVNRAEAEIAALSKKLSAYIDEENKAVTQARTLYLALRKGDDGLGGGPAAGATPAPIAPTSTTIPGAAVATSVLAMMAAFIFAGCDDGSKATKGQKHKCAGEGGREDPSAAPCTDARAASPSSGDACHCAG